MIIRKRYCAIQNEIQIEICKIKINSSLMLVVKGNIKITEMFCSLKM